MNDPLQSELSNQKREKKTLQEKAVEEVEEIKQVLRKKICPLLFLAGKYYWMSGQ